jgi:molybdate transport system substrate-binding protein
MPPHRPPRANHRRRFVLALWLGALALVPARAAPTATLEVAAASSLAEAMPALAKAFEASQPGVTVKLSTGASGALLEQLAQGAPVDVLLSADADTLARGVERRLLQADSLRAFASNTLVLVLPAASTLPVQRLTDLALVDVQRIAMGRTASVPAGRYARQAIDAARLWPALQRKIVPADSARHALDLVKRGDVDAAFVYGTDARSAGSQVRLVQTLAGHSPIRLSAAVAAGSKQAALAAAFVQWLRSDAARTVLSQRGFGTL